MNLKEWLTKTFRKHKHKHDLLMDILMENNTNYLIFQCKCGHEYDNTMDNFCSNCLASK